MSIFSPKDGPVVKFFWTLFIITIAVATLGLGMWLWVVAHRLAHHAP